MEHKKRMSVVVPPIKDLEEEVKQLPEQQQTNIEEERDSSGEGAEQ